MNDKTALKTELENINDRLFVRRQKRAELKQALAELDRADENDNKRVMVIAATLLGE